MIRRPETCNSEMHVCDCSRLKFLQVAMFRRDFFRKHHPRPSPAARLTRTEIAADKLVEIAEDEDRLPARPRQWLILMLVASIVGALVGVVGAAFRLALMEAARGRLALIEWSHHTGVSWIGWLFPMLACALGAGLACFLTQRFAPWRTE